MIDFAPVLVALVTGVFGVVTLFINYQIQNRIKDAQARTVIAAAANNALGAMQMAATGVVSTLPPVAIPGVPADFLVGVQYMLNHAGPELARFPEITAPALADKLIALTGGKNIASNIAAAASTAPTPAPLAPINIPPLTVLRAT